MALFKQVYQLQETVEVYEDSHYIEPGIKKAIAAKLLELLCKNRHNHSPVTILDAGIGGGRLVLLPLIDAAIEKNIPLRIIGVDNSEAMINDLRASLKSRNFQIDNGKEFVWFESIKDNCSLTAYNFDLEDHTFIFKLGEELDQVDAVVSILTLHHSKNWRLSLLPLIQKVREDGILILFEWTEGIKLRDGNFIDNEGKADLFKSIDGSIVNFWKLFYKERYKYNLWFPEIMASDYSKIAEILKKPFFYENKYEFTWTERKSVTWGTLKKWIAKGAYSNFYRGLSEKNRRNLVQWVDRYYSDSKIDANQPTGEQLGCRVRIFKKQCNHPGVEKVVILDSIFNTSLYEKLIYEHKEHHSLLDIASLFVQHDAITNKSLFFTINLWDILTQTWSTQKREKPLVINASSINDKFLTSLFLYYAIIEKLNFSVTDFVFREMMEKSVLFINKTDIAESDRFFSRNLRTKTLHIALPVSLLSENCSYLEKLFSKSEEYLAKHNINSWQKTDGQDWMPLKEDIWNFVLESEKARAMLTDLMNETDIVQLNACINKNLFDNFCSKLKSHFESEPILFNAAKDGNKFDIFCKILVFHLIIKQWDCMVYVPSEMLVEDAGEKAEAIGFGGFIIAENNNNDSTLKQFLEKRVEMLRSTINLKFRAIGARQWADKRTKDVKEARYEIIEYPHIVGDYGIKTIKAASRSVSNKKIIALICDFMTEKTEYLSMIAEEQNPILKSFDLHKLINNLKKSALLISRFAKISEENIFTKAINTWNNILSDITCSSGETFLIRASKPVVCNILENLITNTLKHFTDKVPLKLMDGDYDKLKASILLYEEEQYMVFQYCDNGVGFTEENFSMIEQWRKGIFLTQEKKNQRKGLGFYSIQKSVNMMTGSFLNIKSESLPNGRLKGIFCFKFPKGVISA